ncbi:MAG TPA: DinB family protein [Dehalococcoidia bacterium]|nr:DinB family protein [Dehalococcoidia bacterium]
MDPAPFAPMYAFNTWANEGIREGMHGVSAEYLRKPLNLWFDSAFAVTAHLYAGEKIWLARLRDGVNPTRLLSAADFASTGELVEAWRDVDAEWETYIATLSGEQLDEIVTWQSQRGGSFSHIRWQLLLHVPFHSSEHRAHAGTALTQLGLSHGPQDFHLQFMPEEAAEAAARAAWQR